MEPKYEVRKSLERIEFYLKQIITEYETMLFHIQSNNVNLKKEEILDLLLSFEVKKKQIETLKKNYLDDIQSQCSHYIKEDWFDVGDEKELFLKYCVFCEAILE